MAKTIKRRDALAALAAVAAAWAAWRLTGNMRRAHAMAMDKSRNWQLSDAEWRRRLTPEQYRILRQGGTEPPFSSPLLDEHRAGTYVCAGCGLALFDAAAKFDSGTGWPSFHSPIEGHVETRLDFILIIPRTEYHCARCGGHQGHVFDDGPPPTGQRWCNNGAALRFVPA